MASTKDVAKEWGISPDQVREYCKQGLVYGAVKENNQWLIPDHSPKPPVPSQLRNFLYTVSRDDGKLLDRIKNADCLSEDEIESLFQYLELMNLATKNGPTVQIIGNGNNVQIDTKGRLLSFERFLSIASVLVPIAVTVIQLFAQ